MKVVLLILALTLPALAQESVGKASHECQAVKGTISKPVMTVECVDRRGEVSTFDFPRAEWPWAAAAGTRNFHYLKIVGGVLLPMQVLPTACEPGLEKISPVPDVNTCGAVFQWPDGRRR